MEETVSDLRKLQNILGLNNSKNFVQRILHKDQYPVIDLGGGKHETHQMTYSDADGRFFVYPEVVYNPEKRQLMHLEPDQAWEHAMSTGEYIEFNNKKEADWFSKNYKKVWD